MIQDVIILLFTAFLWWHTIQDMPELSIRDKTVGTCLPRLRCGAIGWRIKLPIKSQSVQELDALTAKKVFGWRNVH
jgi:hypothetical protein